MTLQILLIAFMGVLLVYGWRNRQHAPVIGWAIMVTATIGTVLSGAPGLLQPLANFVGVGRGVDLMFYLFIASTILLIANIHLRMRKMWDSITDLVRRLAIETPEKRLAGPEGERRGDGGNCER